MCLKDSQGLGLRIRNINTRMEIAKAVWSFRPVKSPRPDGLRPFGSLNYSKVSLKHYCAYLKKCKNLNQLKSSDPLAWATLLVNLLPSKCSAGLDVSLINWYRLYNGALFSVLGWHGYKNWCEKRETVRKSKEMGGLGIRASKPKNEAFILELEWRLINESHKSGGENWVAFLRKVYGRGWLNGQILDG